MLKIRLRRMGARHRPFYRLVVSDSRLTPRGRFVESLGHYDPLQTPPEIRIDLERVEYWVSQGALPSDRVKKLVRTARTQGEGDPAAASAPTAPVKEKGEEKKVEEPEAGATGKKEESSEKGEAKAASSEPEAGTAEGEEAGSAEADETGSDEETGTNEEE